MSPQKQISNVIEHILSTYKCTEEVDDDIKKIIIDEYNDLNKKCDNVISKINKRKIKSSNKEKNDQ